VAVPEERLALLAVEAPHADVTEHGPFEAGGFPVVFSERLASRNVQAIASLTQQTAMPFAMMRRLRVDSFLRSSCPAHRTVANRWRTSAERGERGGGTFMSDEITRTGRSPKGPVPRVSCPDTSPAEASAKMASK
jgi:hypothetical protein